MAILNPAAASSPFSSGLEVRSEKPDGAGASFMLGSYATLQATGSFSSGDPA
jgi:hypothetical protein